MLLSELQQVADCIFDGRELTVGESAEFANERVLVDAGKSLNIDGGMFRQPARFSEVYLSA